ncbi:hypothetical protein AAHH88_00325 [Candidatus Hodgkinia cicadicola]
MRWLTHRLQFVTWKACLVLSLANLPAPTHVVELSFAAWFSNSVMLLVCYKAEISNSSASV